MNAFELAKAEVGTVEWKNGDNPKVVAYFRDSGNAGVKDDETAWCAAFVGAMLKRAGMKGTGKLNARSYLQWGVPVERKDARPGDVVIFKRGNSSWQGHVAFFVKDRGALIDVLGGNQSNAVNVKGYQAAALLGIRRAGKVAAKPATAPKKAAQSAKPAKPSPVVETAKGVSAGAGAVAMVAVFWDQISGFFSGIAAKWEAFWVWAFSILN
jgi:uncharacterized protein (TIGR02594 family)